MNILTWKKKPAPQAKTGNSANAPANSLTQSHAVRSILHLQRTIAPNTADSNNGLDQHRSNGGKSLSPETRDYFEHRFGHDFADVRVHTDRPASESASRIQSRAYTIGNDITFAAGEYQPWNKQGKKLLAHELAHVVQQSGGAERSNSNALGTMLSGTPNARIQRDIVPGPPRFPTEALTGLIIGPSEAEWLFRHVHGADNPLAIRMLRNYMDGRRTPITLTGTEMRQIRPLFSIQTNYVGYTENSRRENPHFWERWARLLRSGAESIPVNIRSNGFANLRGTLGVFTVHWQGVLRKEERSGSMAFYWAYPVYGYLGSQRGQSRRS
ncbi:MAG: DUF4157 domain-containing protein [Burkholderiales bacterium]|nr:DUF4157 domain-containing protein [Nitrosomonas sp.]MCP5276220.1 DUF4157 domain-containing protein [Burkholderiales bacterium]